MPSKLWCRGLLLVATAVAALPAAPAAAQESSDSRLIYRREVFQYPRAGRPDPFRSVAATATVGPRLENLTLHGVMYDADPRQSVAILSMEGSDRRIRARVGDRVGGMRVLAIQPRRIDLLVEDLGVGRRESLHLRVTPPPQGDGQ